MSVDSVHSPLLLCAICGGTVDDLIVVLTSSVGLMGMAIGFEAAFDKASRVFGWQRAAEIDDEAEKLEAAEVRAESHHLTTGSKAGPSSLD